MSKCFRVAHGRQWQAEGDGVEAPHGPILPAPKGGLRKKRAAWPAAYTQKPTGSHENCRGAFLALLFGDCARRRGCAEPSWTGHPDLAVIGPSLSGLADLSCHWGANGSRPNAHSMTISAKASNVGCKGGLAFCLRRSARIDGRSARPREAREWTNWTGRESSPTVDCCCAFVIHNVTEGWHVPGFQVSDLGKMRAVPGRRNIAGRMTITGRPYKNFIPEKKTVVITDQPLAEEHMIVGKSCRVLWCTRARIEADRHWGRHRQVLWPEKLGGWGIPRPSLFPPLSFRRRESLTGIPQKFGNAEITKRPRLIFPNHAGHHKAPRPHPAITWMTAAVYHNYPAMLIARGRITTKAMRRAEMVRGRGRRTIAKK